MEETEDALLLIVKKFAQTIETSKEIDLNTKIVELNLDSISSLELLFEIEKKFSITLDIDSSLQSELFEKDIKSISLYIEQMKNETK